MYLSSLFINHNWQLWDSSAALDQYLGQEGEGSMGAFWKWLFLVVFLQGWNGVPICGEQLIIDDVLQETRKLKEREYFGGDGKSSNCRIFMSLSLVSKMR